MKQTLFIPLSFSTFSASANVFVPFTVSAIHIKSAGYTMGVAAPAVKNYVLIRAPNIGLNAPLAICYTDTTYSSATIQDIEIKLKNPQTIQGNYEFQLIKMDGTNYTPISAGPDIVGLVIEFNSEDETR